MPRSTKTTPAESAVAVPTPVAVSEEPSARLPRVTRVHTKETLSAEFDDLENQMDAEIERLRNAVAAGKTSSKSQGIKQLRTFLKHLRQIHAHAQRVTRFKKAGTSAPSAQNTGLLKPVRISAEIANFFSWPVGQPKSRVEVTKAVWEYIKSHSLQDPNTKKFVLIQKDSKLAALLRYDSVQAEPVTYCTLQKYLKYHFTPAEPAAASSGAVSATPAVVAAASSVASPAAVVAAAASASKPKRAPAAASSDAPAAAPAAKARKA